MPGRRASRELESLLQADPTGTRLLSVADERELLGRLAACKAELTKALRRIPGCLPPEGGDDPEAWGQQAAAFDAVLACEGSLRARLAAIHENYRRIRERLALANIRLVAHVAKPFFQRGVAHDDLLQDGFCGLLEAIDRFDLAHGTRLPTYATWWIRQAIQRSLAAGAYPVRLSPGHLRQLARQPSAQDECGPRAAPSHRRGRSAEGPKSRLRCIQAATRPSVSLDASLLPGSKLTLLQTMPEPGADQPAAVDRREIVGMLLADLRPREFEVLAFRFGLGGKRPMSLSQVGQLMAVSKERVRQIQDGALKKLRRRAREREMFGERLDPG